jgi:hypothetical protein
MQLCCSYLNMTAEHHIKKCLKMCIFFLFLAYFPQMKRRLKADNIPKNYRLNSTYYNPSPESPLVSRQPPPRPSPRNPENIECLTPPKLLGPTGSVIVSKWRPTFIFSLLSTNEKKACKITSLSVSHLLITFEPVGGFG